MVPYYPIFRNKLFLAEAILCAIHIPPGVTFEVLLGFFIFITLKTRFEWYRKSMSLKYESIGFRV